MKLMTSKREPARCPECSTAFEPAEQRKFCGECGQKLDVGALSLREVLAEFVGTLMSLEFPILLTVRDLLRSPGRVASAWISGKRRSYVNPIKFVVIVGLIVALTYEPLSELRFELHPSGEPVYTVGLAHNYTEYFAFFCLVLLIPLALILRAIGPRLGVTVQWLEWYVLGLYCVGLGVLFQLSINVATLGTSSSRFLLGLEFCLPLLLLAWGAFGFVPRPLRWRALLTSLLSFVVLALGMVVVGFLGEKLQGQ